MMEAMVLDSLRRCFGVAKSGEDGSSAGSNGAEGRRNGEDGVTGALRGIIIILPDVVMMGGVTSWFPYATDS